MGKVYTRLILLTLQPKEDYVDGLVRVYNDEICGFRSFETVCLLK